jgi:hypothetical protein
MANEYDRIPPTQYPWLPPPEPQRVDPIWPTSNPVGTEKFVDYRGWDRPYYPPQPAQDPVQTFIAPAPNTQYGSVLPIARDTQTGESRWAMPSAREFIQGRYGLTQGPRTGTVTPEATMSMGGSALRTSMGGGGSEALRTFGGPRSQTADIRELKQAQVMSHTGATPEYIWRETGWFQGADGRWKYEIPDNYMSFHHQPERVSPSGVPLYGYPPRDQTYAELVDHSRLLAAYPEVGRENVLFNQLPPDSAAAHQVSNLPGGRGTFYFGNGLPMYRDAIHETQHAVQHIERWPRGGSHREVLTNPALAPYFKEEMAALKPKRMTYDEFVNRPGALILGDKYKAYNRYRDAVEAADKWGSPEQLAITDKAIDNVYKRLSGEVEARLAAERQWMTVGQRQASPPFLHYDVPPQRQIWLPPSPRL